MLYQTTRYRLSDKKTDCIPKIPNYMTVSAYSDFDYVHVQFNCDRKSGRLHAKMMLQHSLLTRFNDMVHVTSDILKLD